MPASTARLIENPHCTEYIIGAKAEKPKRDKKIKETFDPNELLYHHADVIENPDDIEAIAEDLYNKGHYAALGVFILGINTGYRPVDLINFKKCDIVDMNGNILDAIGFNEQKTGKPAVMYPNKIIKLMLEWIMEQKNIGYYEYIFTSEGNRTAYLNYDFVNKKNVEEESLETVRIRDHIHNNTISRNLKESAKMIGLDGHFSSYCMRQTFSFHFSETQRILGLGRSEESIKLLSHYFNHSSISVTTKHYIRERRIMKEIVNGLELGGKTMRKIAGII